MKSKDINKEKAFSALGIISGIISIVFSIIVFCMDNGSWENSLQYGGDAYTGIQNAAAQTANNIQALSDIFKIAFGAVLLVGGIVLICVFGLKMVKLSEEKGNDTENIEIKIHDLLEAPVEATVITEEFFETEQIPVPEEDNYTE